MYYILEHRFSNLIHDMIDPCGFVYLTSCNVKWIESYPLLQIQVYWCEANYVMHNTRNITKVLSL
jgi:hypothetical protein